MPSAMGSILRAASRKPGESLNILTACTHERYETNWAKSGHRFWAYRSDKVKDWNTTFAPVPENYVLLDPSKGPQQLPPDIEFDLVVSQNKAGAYQTLAPIANQLQVPLLCLEHTQPHPSWSPYLLAQLKAMRGHRNFFISEFSRNAWGWSEDEADVIHHGCDTDTFKDAPCKRGQHVLSVVNQLRERDWCCGYRFWEEATKGLNRLHIGDSPDGWSKPAASVADLVQRYRECAVFVDTAAASPIPSVVIEAMSVGCIVVSRGNAMIPEVISDGRNGFIREDPVEMRKLLAEIIAEPARFDHVREAARCTILERFSLERFVRDWDRTLRAAADTPWTGPI